MTDEYKLPLETQKNAVRDLMTRSPELGLKEIGTMHPTLADGVKAVQKELEKPKKAGSGTGPVEPLEVTGIL